MEDEMYNWAREGPYPVLFIPKECSSLEINCELPENVFIHLNITTPDAEGYETLIYNGLCNFKIVEGNDILNITQGSPISMTAKDLTEANQITFPMYNESQVWIDPVRSPYVYNRCETPPPLESYTIMEGPENHITIEQHNTINQTDNCNEPAQFSPISDEQIAVQRAIETGDVLNIYAEDEFECGLFLSQLSEGIINEKEIRAREEQRFVGLQTDNEALKQLMSTDIQSVSKQQKTILFLGHDSEFGHTVQNIAINDPTMECTGAGEVESEIVVDESTSSDFTAPSKKYQCNKCKQLFDQLSAFKQHMGTIHRQRSPYDIPSNVRYKCEECDKTLKNKEKFDKHRLAHGNPDYECNMCHKVFASKFTLRNHRKIHLRKFRCIYCVKSYSAVSEFHSHTVKAHAVHVCEFCHFTCDNLKLLKSHQTVHADKTKKSGQNTSDCEITEIDLNEMRNALPASEEIVMFEDYQIQEADPIIDQIMAGKSSGRRNKKQRKYDKTCGVCLKKFDRMSDLKRHLIEHVIQNTLNKKPVNAFGVLEIHCEICQEKTFNKIDRYKAHLREHAKLTLYKCTFCDKSFSDSSNFSKHKKIHGSTFFQCDICQRKFNSKKMISQHIEYHIQHRPVPCKYCGKTFHFVSTLNKHIKCSHAKHKYSSFKCKFCQVNFKTLREKWDHEWMVHNVRKAIVDCLVCGSRFRKYAELKRHCSEKHNTLIPPAKSILKWKSKNKKKFIGEE